jgi:hypothetical protein
MLDDLKSVSDLVNMSILRSEYLILQISETDPKVEKFVAVSVSFSDSRALRSLRQVVVRAHRLQLQGDVTRKGSCSSYR